MEGLNNLVYGVHIVFLFNSSQYSVIDVLYHLNYTDVRTRDQTGFVF